MLVWSIPCSIHTYRTVSAVDIPFHSFSGRRSGGGDAIANQPHIYILRLIFITAMRGPGALSRPTDPAYPYGHANTR